MLNEQYSFHDVRYQISRRVNPHDVALSFTGHPDKTLLPAGTVLVRLDFPVVASPLFNKAGGAEQVFLPNLAKGTGGDRSEHARLRHTYTLKVE